MWIVLVMVMALSGASGINMSIRLGRLDHKGAKQAGYVGICMSSLVCFAISIAVWFKIRYFGMIFSNDTVFLDLFESAKTPFTVTLLLMNIAMAIEKVPYSMGRTTEVFWYGLIASWGGKPLGRDIIYRVLFRYGFQFLIVLFLSSFFAYLSRSSSTGRHFVYHLLERRSIWFVHRHGNWVCHLGDLVQFYRVHKRLEKVCPAGPYEIRVRGVQLKSDCPYIYVTPGSTFLSSLLLPPC
jgi:hypothetical protein